MRSRSDLSLVRVTVTSGTRRVDLALPRAVPVAELVPELARCVGVLDAATAYAGYRLVTPGGRALLGQPGLAAQGVQDGDIITVAAAVEDPPTRLYDDEVEAMADVLERDVAPWGPVAARRARLWAAVVLLALGAGALLTQHAAGRTAAVPGAVAVLLVLTAGVLARGGGGARVAVTVAQLACVYAAVAGLQLGGHATLTGTSLLSAGTTLVMAGSGAALVLTEGRMLMLPAIALGGVIAATGVLMRVSSLSPAILLTVLPTLVVVASGVFPALAMSATRSAQHASGRVDTVAGPFAIDTARVAAHARLAREILVGASAAVGVLLVALAPAAVSLGPVGTAVPALGATVVMLRTRRHRAAVDVLVGLLSGGLGIVSTLVALLWLRSEWRLPLGLVITAAALVLLLLALRSDHRPRSSTWIGDLAESAALLALLPVLASAVGIAVAKA